MENLLFIKIEIFILILSLFYSLYYIWTKAFKLYFNVKKVIKPENIENRKSALNKVNLKQAKEKPKSKKNSKISLDDKDKLEKIVKQVESNIAKWYEDLAKSRIVEWLSIDKYNRELNLILAWIYEKEKNYINAEYIYKDLLEHLKTDFEIMKKLWYVYALQEKLKDSLKIYENIHRKKMADDEVINILSELTYSMWFYKRCLKYTTLFLKSKPRDVEKLFIKAECLTHGWKKWQAIDTYKKIIELQPYNKKVQEKIKELEESLDE